jgi:hypothetical protein
MIGVIFSFGTEIVEVRIKDNNVFFRKGYPTFGDIDGLKLDKSGVIKEFPDLKDKEDWQKQARDRFKKKIKTMKSEKEQIKYVMEDLQKYGYKPLYIQQQGFRPVKIK